ncbi:MAG: beta strand repeat-containing protein [Mucilaginibacter sp.]
MKTRLLLCLILGLLCVSLAHAATTYTWNGGASGNWNTASNWKIGAATAATYPGQSGTTDIALINTSNATLTLTTTASIGSLQSSTFGVSNITVSVSTGNTLTITGNVSTAQPSSAATAFTFSGLGTTKVNGTLSASFNASYAIAANATLTLTSGAIFDESSGNPHGNINNAGTLNLLSGAALKLGDNATLNNSGTVVAATTVFTLNGSPSGLSNTGTIRATSCTFTLTGSGMTFTNSSIATFITDKCTLTSNNSTVPVNNAGAWTDHGSSFSFTGQTNTITNSGASANFHGKGTTITFSSGNNNHSITNSTSATCTLDSGSTLNMGTQTCTLTNSATFFAGTSNSKCTINLTGQGANVTNSGTFKEGSTSVIAPSGVSAKIANSGTFTLQSDASGSATISALSSTASVTGTYNVERYLQGGAGYRSYRLLSSPVFTAFVSSANVYSINYLQNSIYLTGTTTTGGFDNTVAANPTLYLYTETVTNPLFTTFLNSNYAGISKINNSPTYAYSVNSSTYTSTYYIPVGSGFLCFFRGNRSTSFASKTTAPFPVPENTTLTTSGTINTGTLTARNWFNQASATLSYTAGTNPTFRGFNLLGNPYPSTIDWETYNNAGGTGIYVKSITKTVYELNPQTQNFDVYQKGGVFTNNGSRYIASGQGFFVLDTLASVGFVVFNETAKVNNLNTGSNLFMGTPDQQTANSRYLRLQLAMDNINTDDIVLLFNSSASSRFNYDQDALYKAGSGKVGLWSFSDDHIALAINTRPLPKKADAISLSINASTDGIYTLNMKQMAGIPQLFDIWLMDNYKKDSLDMRHNTTYSFNVVKSDTNTFGSKRFSLIIRQNPAYAYHLLSFTAAKTAALGSPRRVQISWTTENEQDYTSFTVERSTNNGITYEVAGSVTASGMGKYSMFDDNPSAKNLYRLKSVDINGAVTYSFIVPILFTDQNRAVQNVSIYPNPVGGTLNLEIATNSATADTYNITITNSSGLIVKQSTSSQANWQASADDLLPGTYVVRVFSKKTQAEVGNTKFVKL